MEKVMAYCGINCGECPAYIATKSGNIEELRKVANDWSTDSMIFKPDDIYCYGCNQDDKIFTWCSECPIRTCCRSKKHLNCAYCGDYICEKLKMTFDKTPSAKQNLDEIRLNS